MEGPINTFTSVYKKQMYSHLRKLKGVPAANELLSTLNFVMLFHDPCPI